MFARLQVASVFIALIAMVAAAAGTDNSCPGQAVCCKNTWGVSRTFVYRRAMLTCARPVS